jgi:hypothetical protein
VDPNDPKDVAHVQALQDATKIEQPGGPGRFEVPNWDQASQKPDESLLKLLPSSLYKCKILIINNVHGEGIEPPTYWV